jgi:asparagine synthase (glutamine-hydrolysing)
MCGIVGVWRRDGAAIDAELLRDATDRLRHRGPDDEGYLLGNVAARVAEPRTGPASVIGGRMLDSHTGQADLAFGFRRLAIIDLSSNGHQPLAAADGALWVVFNGEIYNYVEIRDELQARGHRFRTATDTEVILAAYREWGVECLSRFNGMWAFVLWDVSGRRLFGARDRFGIKPLYYRNTVAAFSFASEIKALIVDGSPTFDVRQEAILDFLTTGFVDHSARSFFVGVEQLPAAHYFIADANGLRIARYWELDDARRPVDGDRAESLRVGEIFNDAVRIHMRSDVPIGSCLSGGIDSSAIVCVANRLLRQNSTASSTQETFSSCFDDPRFDERPFIERVLEQTGARANFVFPRGEDLPSEIAAVVWHHDEPFATTSVYAQWKVMQKAAERGVKVILDGQGGDELFAGYHTYFGYHFADLLRHGRLAALWREARGYARVHGVSMRVALNRLVEPLLGAALRRAIRARLKHEGAGLNREFLRSGGDEADAPHSDGSRLYGRLRELLTSSSLPALLRYEDRDSMAFSVEARVPFLDVRLVELAFSLPASLKIDRGTTKVVLREALRGIIPESVRTRTDKMGFVTPEGVWLRGPLRTWATDILNSPEFRARPYFDQRAVQEYFRRFLAGGAETSGPVWRWIVLELWLRQAGERRARAAA